MVSPCGRAWYSRRNSRKAAIEFGEGQFGFAANTALVDVARQVAEEHLIDGLEEALDAAAAARMPRRGKDQAQLDVGGDLLEVDRGEVAAVVRVEHLGNAEDDPLGVRFPPDRLTQCQGRQRADGLSKEKEKPAMARLWSSMMTLSHGRAGCPSSRIAQRSSWV